MGASTSNPSFKVEVRDQYPYPSHVIAPNFVTVKLSNKSTYNVCKTQMLCLLSSHGMLGFIDGTFVSPDDDDQNCVKGKVVGDMKKAWMRSDSLVKGWILGSLSEEAAIKVVNRLTSNHKESDFTAKDAWDELQSSYGPSVVLQKAVAGTLVQNSYDSMAEEVVQTPSQTPAFAQASFGTPTPGFMFGSGTSTSSTALFQFGVQTNQAPSPNPFQASSPNPFQVPSQNTFQKSSQNPFQAPSQNTFQASGSAEFSAGGSFSLGSGGGDKSGRKFVKVKQTNRRK